MDDSEFRQRHNDIDALLDEGRLAEATQQIAVLRSALEPASVQLARVELLGAKLLQAEMGRNLHGDPRSLSAMVEAALHGAYEILEQHPKDAAAMRVAAQVAIDLAERSGQFGEVASTARWYREAALRGAAAGDRFAGTQDLFGASASFSIAAGQFDAALESLAASSADFELPQGDRALQSAPGEPAGLAEAVERAMVAAFERGTVRLAFDLAKALLVARLNAGASAADIDAVANLLRGLVESGRDDDYAVKSCRVLLRAERASPGMLAALGHAVGLAADRLGRYAEAGEFFRAALECVSRHAELAEHPLVLRLRYEVAENARFLGANEEAKTGFAHLAALYERLGTQDAHVARVFNNYADVLGACGSVDEAEKWAGRALTIRQTLLEPPHHDLGRSHATLGSILQMKGKREQARLHAEQAVANFAHAPGRESERYATALHLQAANSSIDVGLPLLREAVSIFEGLSDATAAAGLAKAYRDLALMEFWSDDRASALRHAQRAVEKEIERVEASAELDVERLTALAASVRQAHAVYLPILAHETVDPDEVARAFALQTRVSGLVSGIAARRRAWLERERPDLHEQVHRRISQRASIRPSDLLATPEELAAAALKKPASLPEAGNVSERLAAHEALIQFVRVPSLPNTDRADRYLVFVVRPDSATTLVPLDAAAETDQLVETFQQILSGQGRWRAFSRGTRKRPLPRGEDIGVQLRRRLWDPVREVLQAARTVYVVPDAALFRLPFGALVDDDGSFLADACDFAYLTTAAHWEDFGTKPGRSVGRPLVLADPAFDLIPNQPHQPPAVTGPFKPLGGALREGQRVAELLGVRALVGAAARIGELAVARSPEILHLATHGFAEQVIDWAGESRPQTGIALAGVNDMLAGRKLPGDAGRGILDQAEVTALDLADTDLVVLSACSTAAGAVETGEGVSGLTRAFLIAGARSVLATLWKVDDDRTVAWMEAFYAALLSGASRVEAMSAARKALRRSHPDQPGCWAPFVLFGDPGPLVRAADLPVQRRPDVEIHGNMTVRRIDVGGEQLSWAQIGADPSVKLNAQARAAQKKGDHERTLELVHDLLADPQLSLGHAEARNTQGFSHLNRGEVDAALMAFTAGLYLSPEASLTASLLHGRATGRLMAGDPLGAIADLDRVIPLYADDHYRASHLLVNRAQAHRALGAWDASVADANAVLALADAPAEQIGFAHALLGHAHQAHGDRTAAEDSFGHAMKLAAGTPAEPHAALCLAVLYQQAGESSAAVRWARSVIDHPHVRPADRAVAESMLSLGR